MDSPLVSSTIQAAALNLLSNVLAQLITCYQNNSPWTIDIRDLTAFVTFSLISAPPNYIWQIWLEATFPGYSQSLTPQQREMLVDEVVAGKSTATDSKELKTRDVKQAAMTGDSAPKRPNETKKKLSIKNTAIKFLIDQTFGAAFNTVLFQVGIALLQGRSLEQGMQECRQGFWPLIRAGQRLWPIVSIINLTLVPVERRMVFGGIIGVFWGIYLSLISGDKKTKTA